MLQVIYEFMLHIGILYGCDREGHYKQRCPRQVFSAIIDEEEKNSNMNLFRKPLQEHGQLR